MAYSHSPFENTQTTEQGGSIAMAVLNARYKQPSSAYSQGLKDLIDSMLKVNPVDRPDSDQVSERSPLLIACTDSTTGDINGRAGSADPEINDTYDDLRVFIDLHNLSTS